MDKTLYDTLMAGLEAGEKMYREDDQPTVNLHDRADLFAGWVKAVRKAQRELEKHRPRGKA